MIFQKTFRDRLSILIGDRGAQYFAIKTGVTEDTILKYINGEALPNLKNLEQIAESNGVTIGWLIGEEHQPQKSCNIISQNSNNSLNEMVEWIGRQKDGIQYWEVLKAYLAREYPDFKTWLKKKRH